MALDRKQTIKLGDSKVRIAIDPKDPEVIVSTEDAEIGQFKMKKTDLWLLLFAIADDETQDALMPVRKTQVMKFERVHTIQTKKAMRKGELLTVKCIVDVDKTVRDAIANGTGGIKE